MAFSVCRIRNVSGSEKTWCGVILQDDEFYSISDHMRIEFALSQRLLDAIDDGDAQIWTGSSQVTGATNQKNYLQDYYDGGLL